MKILKIFSMVLALHLVLLVVFLVSPGCRSQPGPSVSEPTAAQPVSENWSNQDAAGLGGSVGQSTLDPVPVGGVDTYSNQPLLGQNPADRARSAPTRPAASGEVPRSSTGASGSVLEPIGQAPVVVPVTLPPEPTLIVYSVRRGDSLWSISRQFGVTVQDIVDANPGINPNTIQYGQKVMVPDHLSSGTGTGRTSTDASSESEVPEGASSYTVKSGDYLARIASLHGVTVGAIRQANRLSSDLIQVGQVLIIPGSSSGVPSRGRSTGIPTDAVTVTVQPGDTIGEIARNYDVTVRELLDANGITDPRKLRVGQTLIIPGFTSVDSTHTSVTVNPAPMTISAPVEAAPLPVIENSPIEGQDLDQMLGGDDLPAPVIPIDEPVPTP